MIMKLVWLMAVINSLFLLNVGFVRASGYSPDEHTVLLMHFDEGKGNPVDSSGKGNHGINVGATWTTGKFGNALSFDGEDDYVLIPHASQTGLDMGTGSFTLEAWIKRTSTGGGQHEIILGKRLGFKPVSAGYLFLITGTNSLRLEVSDGTDEFNIWGATAIDLNWHHVAVVFDRDNLSNCNIYLDGVDDTSSKGVLTDIGSLANAKGFNLGNVYPYHHYSGLIDEVRISNKARSLDEMITSDDSFVSGTITSPTINGGEPITNICLNWENKS